MMLSIGLHEHSVSAWQPQWPLFVLCDICKMSAQVCLVQSLTHACMFSPLQKWLVSCCTILLVLAINCIHLAVQGSTAELQSAKICSRKPRKHFVNRDIECRSRVAMCCATVNKSSQASIRSICGRAPLMEAKPAHLALHPVFCQQRLWCCRLLESLQGQLTGLVEQLSLYLALLPGSDTLLHTTPEALAHTLSTAQLSIAQLRLAQHSSAEHSSTQHSTVTQRPGHLSTYQTASIQPATLPNVSVDSLAGSQQLGHFQTMAAALRAITRDSAPADGSLQLPGVNNHLIKQFMFAVAVHEQATSVKGLLQQLRAAKQAMLQAHRTGEINCQSGLYLRYGVTFVHCLMSCSSSLRDRHHIAHVIVSCA